MTIKKLLGRIILVITITLIPIFVSRGYFFITISIFWTILIFYFFWPITKRKLAKKILYGRNNSSRKNIWLSRYELLLVKSNNAKLKDNDSPYRWYITDSCNKNGIINYRDIGNDLILAFKEKTKRL